MITIQISECESGDLIVVNGEEDNIEKTWKAKIYDVELPNKLKVKYFVPTDDKTPKGNTVWRLDHDVQELELECVEELFSGNYFDVDSLGLCRIKEGLFTDKHEECTSDDERYDDLSSWDETSEDESFIVTSDDEDGFTMAESEDEFVKETHIAVNEFNSWKPKNEREAVVKRYIQHLESQVKNMQDELDFRRGQAPDYKRPKV